MGNCQAAEAATVLIQHPGGRLERVYWSLSASQVMAANPGHYVAVIITSSSATNSNSSGSSAAAAPVKHLKLLRPDDTLHIGHVYRLVSFEEVLKEFASKKHVKLSRLLLANKEKGSSKRERGGGRGGGGRAGRASNPESSPAVTGAVETEEAVEEEMQQLIRRSSSSRGGGGGGTTARHGQWRPALQSIAEFGS